MSGASQWEDSLVALGHTGLLLSRSFQGDLRYGSGAIEARC